ncbi:hypothetical protein MKW98_025154 [Papaver atlanticum]|uniref:Uncharacterized protein n=1 Tax=Papaver atlanticum TaxID=357466 RepID=A0AAD4S2N3_9MAGN|nr:hypothetical protein MKW98_025154 [Papaver atlanticum]
MEEESIVVYDLSWFKIVMMMLKKLVFDFGMCGLGSLSLKGIRRRVVRVIYLLPEANLSLMHLKTKGTT